VEWFALDMSGMISLSSSYASGDYQFALDSDDGSILDIDGNTIVNNDSQHATTMVCAKASVNLKQGDLHSIRVRYFQGPREEIALRLLWRPASQNSQPCDPKYFTAVPADVLLSN
jgi:hypothetical protein